MVLSNGETWIVHEPRTRDLAIYFRAMPALDKLEGVFKDLFKGSEGITGLPINIPDDVIEGVAPLFSIMAGLTVDEFYDLPGQDGMLILMALWGFAPKNEVTTSAPTSENGQQVELTPSPQNTDSSS